jgi:mRNA interferase RelE/StbE
MKALVYLRSASKELLAINTAQRVRIVAKLKQYAGDPDALANQVKALNGVAAWRLRIGDYRVLFRVELEQIVVLKVGHRRDVYE